MPLAGGLFLLLACAHALGRLCERLRQPALTGHLLAGVALGPSLLGWFAPSGAESVAFGALADLALLFVVWTAGLQMRLRSVLDAFRGRGAAALSLGFILPALAGAGAAAVFAIRGAPMIAIALCASITALPVALQILGGFGLMQTRIAQATIAGALLADIAAFVILGMTMAWMRDAQVHSFAVEALFALARLGGLIAAIAVAYRLSRMLCRRNEAESQLSAANIAIAAASVVGLGALSEALGFHFAIGTFFAAMIVTPELIGARAFERLTDACETLTAAVFGPLFLAYQGVQFELRELAQPAFALALLASAALGKLLGGYAAGRMLRMNAHEAWGVGIVMNARGVMGLAAANIAFRSGLIDASIYSALLAMALVTTVLTPPLLQRWRLIDDPARASQSARA